MHAGFVLVAEETRCSGRANFAHSLSIQINEVVPLTTVTTRTLVRLRAPPAFGLSRISHIFIYLRLFGIRWKWL